jgi:cytochrome c-type biogenesis protein CcmH/NrfF
MLYSRAAAMDGPWTRTFAVMHPRARVATWVLWGAAGVILTATAIVSYRSGARRSVYAGLATATVLAVAAIILFRSL